MTYPTPVKQINSVNGSSSKSEDFSQIVLSLIAYIKMYAKDRISSTVPMKSIRKYEYWC